MCFCFQKMRYIYRVAVAILLSDFDWILIFLEIWNMQLLLAITFLFFIIF